MKKSEITTEMFEAWKTEMREVFKDDPKSMDLIAMGLGVIDDESKKDLHDGWNTELLQYMENDLANAGKLDCEFCGKPMEVYYTVQCFHCAEAKPKIEKYKGNYLCAVKWLQNNEPEFDKDLMWDYLYEHDILRGNDTYIVLEDVSDNETGDNETGDNETDDYAKNIRLFKKHFPIEDITWFVSW